ncbi:MAG: hypothetical protein GZ087_04145 [Flavobacterium sp.]|nr:hypothetical protein [Flavobacterium sp.]
MKILKIFFITTILFSLSANSQITKNNWMMGGNITFSNSVSSPDDNSSSEGKSNSIDFSPNIGYFIINKLSIGTLYQYISTVSKYEGGKSEYKSSNIGPFVRYYLLNPEKTANIFLETSYNFSTMKENNNTVFASKLGAVYFLNSSVGFELMFKYSINKYKYNTDLIPNSTSKGLTVGLGFQIHLEKEKN